MNPKKQMSSQSAWADDSNGPSPTDAAPPVTAKAPSAPVAQQQATAARHLNLQRVIEAACKSAQIKEERRFKKYLLEQTYARVKADLTDGFVLKKYEEWLAELGRNAKAQRKQLEMGNKK